MKIEEILIIKNAHESYGISTKDINQISRVPSLMLLPLCPFGVRGLCSVGGNVVSMIDFNLLLNIKQVNIEDTRSRIISLNDAFSSNTLLVTDIYNTVEIKQTKIEYLENKDDAVIAIYKYNDSLVQIVSLEKLFSHMKNVSIQSTEIITKQIREIEKEKEDSLRYLIFSMGNEKFALEIDYLQEIILADIEITDIVCPFPELMGLITLREEILVLLDLRIYYNFKAEIKEDNRILIIFNEGKKIALYIDGIIDIKNFLKKDIEYTKEKDINAKLSGVIHGENGLISFFDNKVIENIFKKNEAYIESSEKEQTDKVLLEGVMEVIVFKLASKEYAFNVENVDEIIDMVEPTSIVFSDESMDGIINIRGQVISIVSLFKKLNIETVIQETSKIIVCNINDNRIGFVVDSVSDIINIQKEDMREDDDGYFESILYLEGGKRLVLSMDINKIVFGDSNA